LLLWALGLSGSSLLAERGEFARVSLGGGAWLLLFALFILLSDLLRRLERLPLATFGLLGTALLLSGLIVASGRLNDLSLLVELLHRKGRFLQETGNHLWITFFSVLMSTAMGIPLGLGVFRLPRLRSKAFFVLNMVQTIPSLALFGLLIAPLALLVQAFPALEALGVRGIGWTPAVIALTLYGLLPIVRNTYAGFAGVEPAVTEAGRGIGMSRGQLLFFVEIPLALPVILNGLRTACVQNIGNTAVAALIGAGGFGVFIFQGLGQAALDLIMLGAVPTILLAVAVDLIWQGGILWLGPR
jgi:osmoprotectant transport system permease protein